MFNRFKSALLSSVGASESAAAAAAAAAAADGVDATGGGVARPVKFPYGRPAFLQLETEDELQVAGDRVMRPIIVPRDSSRLPWTAGYAEAVNAGKSKRNEDAAAVYTGVLHQPAPGSGSGDGGGGDAGGSGRSVPYYYFGMFDGHAGHGASVAAAHQLHHIIHERLVDVLEHLLPPDPADEPAPGPGVRVASLWVPAEEVAPEKLVTGALEAAFHDMDALIAEDRLKYEMRGGCTAVVALLLLGRLYVANAGDSRATYCRRGRAVLASRDFTPESERHRVRQLAAQQPALAGGEFTHLDFVRRVTRRDLGKRVLYRDAHMTGWAYKTVTERDLRFPIVCGDGKRSRVCATIGVTRGFGDHDLKAQNTSVNIKPFLSSQPEVLVVDLERETDVTESDVLVMATDGLWDVISNERAAELVEQSLAAFPADDVTKRRYRCTSAAQDLVMAARGKLKERLWRLSDGQMATIDDISVFVVPLLPYREEHLLWKLGQEASAARSAPAPVAPPPGVRQVSEPAQLDRYQSLVEQCGRPATPSSGSPPISGDGNGTTAAGVGTAAGTAAANATAAVAAGKGLEAEVETGEDASAVVADSEFADAESGDPAPASASGRSAPVQNGPTAAPPTSAQQQLAQPQPQQQQQQQPRQPQQQQQPAANAQGDTVPVMWFGGEDAIPVRRPPPR